MGWLARNRSALPRLLVSLVIAGGFVWLMRSGGIPILPPAEALGSLQLWSLLLYVPLVVAATMLRTYRWVYLLRPMRPELSGMRVLGIGLIGFAGVLFAPLRMGEVVRPWLLSQDRQIGFVQAAGTVVAERIVDGLLLTLLLAAALWSTPILAPLPDHIGNLPLPVALVPTIAKSALLTFVAAFVAMALFYFWRARAHRVVNAVLGVISKPLARFVTAQVERLSDSFHFLLSPRYGSAFVRDSIAYWAVTVLSIWVLLRGVGADATPAQASVTLGVMGLATLLPSGPGFFGTFQMGAYCGLALFYPERFVLGAGAVFTFVAYVTQLVVTSLCMLLGLWLMARTSNATSAVAPPGAAPSQHPH